MDNINTLELSDEQLEMIVGGNDTNTVTNTNTATLTDNAYIRHARVSVDDNGTLYLGGANSITQTIRNRSRQHN